MTFDIAQMQAEKTTMLLQLLPLALIYWTGSDVS